MAHIPCPSCSAPVLEPPSEYSSAKRDCARCKEPLVYFKTGPMAGSWHLDEIERSRRAWSADLADAA